MSWVDSVRLEIEMTETVSRKIEEELRGLAGSIDELIRSFRSMQRPIEESRRQVPEATMQLERINQQAEEATHRVLDMVEMIANESSAIVQDLTVLRKALPATYFKNRSKVRDTFEKIRRTSASCQENAFAIMDALQFQDITSQQLAHTASLLDAVETKLHSIKGLFGSSPDDANEDLIAKKSRAFDPDARYESSGESQNQVDELVSSVKNRD
jgi:chemotaxis regulatin CheY-phosphate phosphatase CheZ